MITPLIPTRDKPYLSAPELDSPVKRRANKKMREVERASGRVAAQASHGALMALKGLRDACLTALTHKGRDKTQTQ